MIIIKIIGKGKVYVQEQKVKSIGEVTSGGSHEWVKSFKKDSIGSNGI